MSAFSKDPDIQKFIAEYQHTDAGRAFRMAWNDQVKAVRQLRLLPRLFSNANDIERETANWRRLYIHACNRAAAALTQLTVLYGWPERALNLNWTYSVPPVARARFQSPKSPSSGEA
jgi:hypothetical protein